MQQSSCMLQARNSSYKRFFRNLWKNYFLKHNYDRVTEFSTKLQNVENSQATLLVISPHDVLIEILKFQEHSQEPFVMESGFSIVIGDSMGSSSLKELYQKRFSRNPLKFSKQEKCMTRFFINVSILIGNLVTLIKQIHYRSFLKVFLAISEHFFLGVCFVKARNFRLQVCSVSKEEAVLQRFFRVFEILEHTVQSEYFQKSICNGGFRLQTVVIQFH